MIRLTCANCQAQLEVEDAFAGGVCRCRHCGAIQTVPRRGQTQGVGQSVAGTTAAGEGQRTLYSVKSRAGLSSTPSGLEELAEAVHGSGLAGSGSGLLNRPGVGRAGRGPNNIPVPPARPSAGRKWLAAGVGAAAVLLLAAGLIYVKWHTAASDPSEGPAAVAGGAAAGTGATARPKFAGVELSGNKVVYVLDRGDATAAFLPALRDLTVASVKSLGPDRLFQIVLWDNGTVDAYPQLAPGYASAAEADKLGRWFDGVTTGGSTSALPALRTALSANPDTVVLATGKSLQLDNAFADGVIAQRPPRTIVHAFTLGETAGDDPLRKIAKAAGGRFEALSGDTLTPAN